MSVNANTVAERIARQLHTPSHDGCGYLASVSITKSEDGGSGELHIYGYASTGEIDRMDDVIVPDAFASSLRSYLDQNPVVLYQHDHDKPIGKTVDAKIDAKGLLVHDVIYNQTDTQKEASTLIRQGVLRSLSIGGIVRGSGWKTVEADNVRQEVREITSIELVEHSVVSVPANRGSQFAAAHKAASMRAKAVRALTAKGLTDQQAVELLGVLEQSQSALSAAIEALRGAAAQTQEDGGAGDSEKALRDVLAGINRR